MSSGKKKLIIFFLFVMVLAIPASVYVVLQQQKLESQAEPATILSFDPPSSESQPIRKTVEDTFTLNININTATNSVSGAELHIQYDPLKLQAVSFDIASVPLLPVVSIDGSASGGFAFIQLLSPPSQVKKGTGSLATLTLKALASTDGAPTLVRFTTNTRIAGTTGQITEPGNILASQPQPAVIVVNAQGPSATPTISDSCIPSNCTVCAIGAVCKQVPDVSSKKCECQFPTTPSPISSGSGFGAVGTPKPTVNVGIGGTVPTTKPSVATASPTLKVSQITPASTSAAQIPVTGNFAPTTILTIGGAILTLVGVVSLLAF